MLIKGCISKAKPKNPLEGAVYVAIEKAERYGTPLVVKRNGKVEELSPAQMKHRLRSKT